MAVQESGNNLHIDHHSNTDSDIAGINDSDEEDETFHYDAVNGYTLANEGPFQVVIEGCGTAAVKGTYHQDGYFESACKYGKEGPWNGNPNQKFNIFQCNVSNNTRHWYISIVPARGQPGTSADIDFYTAPVTQVCEKIPPTTGWTKAQEGADPPPTLSFRQNPDGLQDGQENDNWSGRENGEGHGPQPALDAV